MREVSCTASRAEFIYYERQREQTMGANSTQGAAVALSLAGCCVIPISAFFGGILTAVVGLALIGVSIALFRKCKPWENAEDGGTR